MARWLGPMFLLVIPVTIALEQAALLLIMEGVTWGAAYYNAALVFLVTTPMLTLLGGTIVAWSTVVPLTGRVITAAVFWAAALLGATSVAVACGALGASRVPSPTALALPIGINLIGGLIAVVAVNQAVLRARAVATRSRRVPCPGCGYDMRGQKECRCPECGRQFSLSELLVIPGVEVDVRGLA